MIQRLLEWMIWHLLVACVVIVCVGTVSAQTRSRAKHKARGAKAAAADTANAATTSVADAKVIGQRIRLADGSVIQADEVWKNGEDLWYRVGGVTQRVGRSVSEVEPVRVAAEKPAAKSADASTAADAKPPQPDSFWILLKGGARMKVDDVTQNEEGAWYRRGNLSMFLERDRIDRIERESALAKQTAWKQKDWTTGSDRIDSLIRENGARFNVDPYLVFCVMEHESHFHTRAVSPKGALGLMQLMPGTASRFGVRRPFDPAQNIFAGTQYLKELLQMFGGRLDLALASYNAGEGAVIKYGGNVPPYRETRDYVKRVTNRYGADAKAGPDKNSPTPQ